MMITPEIPELDSVGVHAGWFSAHGVDAFFVYEPQHNPAAKGKLVVVAVDDEGLFDARIKHMPGRLGGEQVRREAESMAEAMSSSDWEGDRFDTVLRYIGILPCEVRKGGGSDAAVGIGCLLVNAYPTLDLHARSDIVRVVDERLRAAGLDRVLRAIGPERIELVLTLNASHNASICLPRIMMGFPSPILRAFRTPINTAKATLDAVRTFPTLAVAFVDQGFSQNRPKEVALSVLKRYGVAEDSRVPFLRRLVGVDLKPIGQAFLRFMEGIPLDWVPARDQETEWRAFRVLLPLLNAASTIVGTPVARLAEGTAGRWDKLGVRLASHLGFSWSKILQDFDTFGFDLGEAAAFKHAFCDVVDVKVDFMATVSRPWAAHLRGHPLESPIDLETLKDFSTKFLMGDRTILSVVEASRLWHERGVTIEGRRVGEWEWTPLVPDWRHPDSGLHVVSISDRRGLEDEGKRGPDRNGVAGLGHCVANYSSASWKGGCAIVSVRRAVEDSFVRLSTAEIRLKDRFEVHQHRSFANGVPLPAADLAIQEYVQGLNDGSIPVDRRAWAVARSRQAPSLEEECGYDWRDRDAIMRAFAAWKPYLPSSRTASLFEASIAELEFEEPPAGMTP